MITPVVDKKVQLQLAGQDGNAFNILGVFSRAAKKEGWTMEEIEKVTNEAMKDDYNHLLATILAHTEPPKWEDDDAA